MATSQHFRSLLTLLFFSVLISTHAQDFQNQPRILSIQSDNEIELTLNPDGKKLLGLFVSNDSSIQSIIISNRNPFSVWLDGKLISPLSDYHDLRISELLDKSGIRDTAFLSFYDEKGFTDFDCEFVYKEVMVDYSTSSVKLRQQPYNKNTFILFLIIFMILLATFKIASGNNIIPYFSKVFFRNIRVSIFENDSNTTYLEILLASLMTGMAIWHIKNGEDIYYINYLETQSVAFLKYSGITLLLLLGKFLLIRIVAYLNGLGAVYLIQFVDFLKFLLIVSVFLNLLFFSFYWFNYYPTEYISDSWEYIFPVLYILFAIYYFFKLSSAVTGKKLLIISYLCTTEILGAYIVASILIN